MSLEITKKQLLSFVLLALGFITVFLFTPTIANAADADIQRSSVTEISYIPNNDYVTVKQTVSFNITNPQVYYSAYTKLTLVMQDFETTTDQSERSFKKSTLTISDSDNSNVTNYTATENTDGIELKIGREREINSYNKYQVTITYKTHELLSQKGNVTSIFVPGISEKQLFFLEEGGISTELFFTTKIIVPEATPLPSEISPTSFKQENTNGSRTYSIDGKDLVGKMGWIQFGTEQYNYFKIVQKSPKTDYVIPTEISQLSSIFSTNIFRIVLPREYEETNQYIYYKSITPRPTKIERDLEGNIIAEFEVPANQETEIIAEGYITTRKNVADPTVSILPKIAFNEYLAQLEANTTNKIDVNRYISSDKYWQSDSPEIQSVANELLVGKSNFNDIILADYDYVIGALEYDYNKIKTDNPRLGAISALQSGKGVCMEYSDLLIAILRAQKIPSRTAFGYGNDPLIGTEDNSSINTTSVANSRIGHQWVQIWIPEQGWISIDPTWGETGREYIGPDLDHILWSTMSTLSGDSVFDTYLLSANQLDAQSLNTFDIQIRTVNKEIFDFDMNSGLLEELNTITVKSTSSSTDDLSTLIKTTPLGKSIVVVLPSFIALILLIILVAGSINIIKILFKKAFAPKSIKAANKQEYQTFNRTTNIE
jgi:transglutaminase-like putative cysteine protease